MCGRSSIQRQKIFFLKPIVTANVRRKNLALAITSSSRRMLPPRGSRQAGGTAPYTVLG